MKKLNLRNVTLYGADTIDLDRQLKAFAICESYADFGAKKILTNITKEYTTDTGIQVINTNLIHSLRDYNQFNLKHLNDYIDTEFVMVAEYDGFILNPGAWTDEFLNYDYIGAPLLVDGIQLVGNGGFSIRSKKFLELVQSDDSIQLGDKSDHKYAENDDWVVSVVKREYLERKGVRFAPASLGHKFSLENNREYGNAWSGQFGYHGLRWTDISAWIKENPQWEIHNPLDKKWPQKNIKAIVFDFGGVIELWKSGDVLKTLAELMGVPIVEFKDEYFRRNHLSNVENIAWEDMVLKVIECFTDSIELKNKLIGIVKDSQSKSKTNHELVSFFPILKADGYKVAILSNATSQLRGKLKMLGIDTLVDEVVVSGEIGFQKPHKEAFHVLFERLGVCPEEVVFIDDAQKSLEKADEIGYTPILFRGNEQLKVDLKNLGINL